MNRSIHKDARASGRMFRKLIASTSLVALLGLAAGPAVAQGVDEIIVTAQKREQAITDVSMSVSALSGTQLRSLGADNLRDLDNYFSNVDIKVSSLGVNPGITVRGVGLNNFNTNNNPSVGVYLDEVFLSSPAMLDLLMMDVERVELLKGPQGTIYGRNTNGGALNIISTKPSPEFNGFANISGGNFEHLKFEGAVGGSLLNSEPAEANVEVTGRISVVYERQGESYWTNTLTDKDLGETDRFGVRGQLALATGNFDANLSIFYIDEEGPQNGHKEYGTNDPSDTLDTRCAPAAAALAGTAGAGAAVLDPTICVDSTGYTDTNPDPFQIALDPALTDRFRIDTHMFGAILKANYDFGPATLTSVTGYLMQDRLFGEGTGTNPGGGALGAPGGYFFAEHDEEIEQVSQELRLAGEADRLNWLLGGIFSHDTITSFNPLQSSGLIGALFGLDPLLWTYDQETTVFAGFASGDFELTDQITLSGGVRYTHEEVQFRGGTTAFLAGGALTTTTDLFNASTADIAAGISLTSVPAPPLNPEEISDGSVSGRAAIEYRPNDDWLVYASFGTSLKSGGYFGDFTFDNFELAPFGPERVNAYEVGAKATLFDGRAQVNAAVFYYSYKDIQTFFPATIGFKLDNLEKADIVGIDVEAFFNPTEGLNVSFGFGWLDTETESAVPEFDGNRLPNAAKYQVTGLARYEHVLWDQFSGAVQLDFKYSGDKFTEVTNVPLNFSDSYTVANARVSFFPTEGNWELSAWVRNFTDKEYFEEVFFAPLAGSVSGFSGPPRTVGGSLSFIF